MKKILLLFTFIFQLTISNFNAQKHVFLNIPKFNDADLTKEKSLIDANAPAEILHRSIHYSVDGETRELIKKVFYRIKIYDKEKASEWLNVEIPLFSNTYGSELLYKNKALVYNIENGKKVITKVERKSKFITKQNKYVKVSKYAFPNVNNGSVIEYSYKITSPFLYRIPLVYISLDIPSVYTEYVFDSAINMFYNLDYTGELMPTHKKIATFNDYKTYSFAYENLKPFHKEKYVKNIDNYRTKIRAEIQSTNFGKLKGYNVSWAEIHEKLMDDDSFGVQLRKRKLTKKIVLPNVALEKDSLEKANKIFEYVKNNYNWNKGYGFYTEKGIKKFLSSKSGNVSDINLTLVMMLRDVGLQADPLLISTVSHGFPNFSIPNLSNFNYVIACVNIGGDYHFYDATEKQALANLLPPRDWNGNGLLLTDKKPLKINLLNNNISESRMTIKANINDDGSISGNFTDIDTGLYAMSSKSHYAKNNEDYKEAYNKTFGEDFTDIASTSVEKGSFKSTMNFSSNSLVDVVGKKIIFNPLLFLTKHNLGKFQQEEERKYPIELLSAFNVVKVIEVDLPKGYIVKNLPKSNEISTDDSEIKYTYTVTQDDNKIVIKSILKIASDFYPKEYYPAFRQVSSFISKAQNQIISLEKK